MISKCVSPDCPAPSSGWGFRYQVPSSNVTCNSPRSPWIKSRRMFALVSITHSITIFPTSFLDGNRNTFLVYIHADILSTSHKQGVPFWKGSSGNRATLSATFSVDMLHFS